MSETKKLLNLLHDALELSMILENESKEFIKASGKIYNSFISVEKIYMAQEKNAKKPVVFKQV